MPPRRRSTRGYNPSPLTGLKAILNHHLFSTNDTPRLNPAQELHLSCMTGSVLFRLEGRGSEMKKQPVMKQAPKHHSQERPTKAEFRDEDAELGAPIEHYHGEPNAGERTGDEGDVDLETLDRDAPFNKTYGRDVD
jgi:hypothetical protein